MKFCSTVPLILAELRLAEKRMIYICTCFIEQLMLLNFAFKIELHILRKLD